MVSNAPVSVLIDEKLLATLHRDGGLEQLEVKGEMLLRIQDPQLAKMRVHMKVAKQSADLTFKTHPHVDKQ